MPAPASLRELSKGQLVQLLDYLASEEGALKARLRYDWRGAECPNRPLCDERNLDASESPLGWKCLHARATQVAPTDPYSIWLVLAGRGFGKTRAGAERARELAARASHQKLALVAATLDEVRDTMVEGESGLLACLPPSELRGGSISDSWHRSMGELFLANGTKFKGFSSEVPDRLRGSQHHGAWGDEVASWKDANRPLTEDTTFSMLLMTLRLGPAPELDLTTTPKPCTLLVGTREKPGLLKQPGVHVTKGQTYDNLTNLSPTFRDAVLTRYEGTRLGRQELLAEILEDIEGAYWTSAGIEVDRVKEAPHLVRIIVAVDPATTANSTSDETGITVAGKGEDGQFYVLDSMGVRMSPHGWASKALDLYDKWSADAIVAEVNNGGDMVEETIRNVRRTVKVIRTVSKRGKSIRAEPIQGLYQQHQVHHVGILPALEDQMCQFPVSNELDDIVDSDVMALTELAHLRKAGATTGQMGGGW